MEMTFKSLHFFERNNNCSCELFERKCIVLLYHKRGSLKCFLSFLKSLILRVLADRVKQSIIDNLQFYINILKIKVTIIKPKRLEPPHTGLIRLMPAQAKKNNKFLFKKFIKVILFLFLFLFFFIFLLHK